MEDPLDLELMMNRFSRLVKEVRQGDIRRNTFQPWEVDFLLDLQACRMTRSRRDEALGRYERAIRRQLERGELPPVRFSDFMNRRVRKACSVPSVASHDAPPLHA